MLLRVNLSFFFFFAFPILPVTLAKPRLEFVIKGVSPL